MTAGRSDLASILAELRRDLDRFLAETGNANLSADA